LLLTAPSSTPAHFNVSSYYLPVNSVNYNVIRDWIANSKVVP